MSKVLSGRSLSKRLNQGRVKSASAALPRKPGLAVILVGEDPASQVYVKRKGIVASRVGFGHQQINMAADSTEAEVLAQVHALNSNPEVDGILVQLPLPKGLDAVAILDAIDPSKDVDGLHPVNAGLLSQGRAQFVACTPLGVMRLLEDAGVDTSGKHAVVIGRSDIVGKPVAQLLLQANCTVTICHSRTRDLAAEVARADIVVAAVGRPEMVKGDWIKPGAVVIDVGINRLDDGRLVGDVDYESAFSVASAITPVPGGVGPMTIAMLMENTLRSAANRQGVALDF
ncbi:MAG: bifunctional methylenetetrahydrofolate dehydrogenase/methenyltetrahydrofolate cyclohydrolase FolD [Myxococcota bacterium]|nr:bifunctional methylenetetrahydrofolate dehydrogenase/methenyltetrahydrofolate cyclohydrolase FolD [Myxococcota bacterium]